MSKIKYKILIKHRRGKWEELDETFFNRITLYDLMQGEEYLANLLSGNLIVKILSYVGLKDKNGKEIYEGDIIRYKPLVGLEECERNAIKNIEVRIPSIFTNLHFDNVEEEHLEVIGNKFENPELLK